MEKIKTKKKFLVIRVSLWDTILDRIRTQQWVVVTWLLVVGGLW